MNAPLSTSWPPREITIRCGQRDLILREVDNKLTVANGNGGALVPDAAYVIVALGGNEPAWTRTVEGLIAAHEAAGFEPNALTAAAAALNCSGEVMAELARTSADPVTIRALAGAGVSNVVQNPNLTTADWQLVAEHRDEHVVYRALDLADTLPLGLADSPDPAAKERVARNPECPPPLLDQLARVDDNDVRSAVAANQSTGPDTFTFLMTHGTPAVLAAIAANPSAPPKWLATLCESSDQWTRSNVAANPATPSWPAAKLMWGNSPHVRYMLATRTDLNATALGWLERYARSDPHYQQTCTRLHDNPRCSPHLHWRLETIQRREEALAEWRKLNPGLSEPPSDLRLRWLFGNLLAFMCVLATVVATLVCISAASTGAWLTVLIGGGLVPVLVWLMVRLYRWARSGLGSLTRPHRPPAPLDAALIVGGPLGVVAVTAIFAPQFAVASVIAARFLIPPIGRKLRSSRHS